MSILLLSDLKKSTRTIIRGKSKTPKTLPALIIRGEKIVQFSKKRPSALIRGRTKSEKLRYNKVFLKFLQNPQEKTCA